MFQFPDLPDLRWRKSSRSAQGNDTCVEVADAGRVIAVRDSKNPAGPAQTFSRREFKDLIHRIRARQLDI